MAIKTVNTRIQTKRDSAANWESKNPVLLNGEKIIVDTNAGEVREKIGDGTKTYSQLPFTDETLRSLISNKVDKVNGKGLSTNDYTTTEKNKLAGIDTGANNYTHPSTHPATIITEDTTHRFVTDTQISTWNAKASTAIATTSANGLMSSTDKTKLDGIATGANNYTLPTASSSTLGGVKTTSTVTSASGLTACPIISGVPYYKDTDTTYSVATTSANGLMSSTDKSNLTSLLTRVSTLETNYNSMLAKLKTAVFISE